MDADAGTTAPKRAGVDRILLMFGAVVAFISAAVVLVLGVVATSGVYGSRMAWLMGVVLPLLALTALLSWLASRSANLSSHPQRGQWGRGISVTALVLVGIPFVLAGMLLFVYGVLIVLHALGLT
jgi:hypothetical protein